MQLLKHTWITKTMNGTDILLSLSSFHKITQTQYTDKYNIYMYVCVRVI
jgi:hypothetical protein